jgi:tetratricopeptide (TPR) repeat protein
MFCARRFFNWVVLLVVLALIAGCGSDEPNLSPAAAPLAGRPGGDLESYLSAGQAALDKGDLAAAEKAYQDAVALDPGSAKAQFGLGNVYVRTGRLTEAEQAYKAALAVEPNMAAGHANLGVTYYQMGQLGQAAAEFDAALKLEPDDPQTLYLMAVVRLQENDLPTAEQLLIQARDRKPDLPEVYYGLGVLYRLKGQKTEAIAAFEKFLAIGPGQDPSATEYAKQELRQLQGQ